MTKYKSKVEIIYEVLLDAIVEGKYGTGERLVISQISKEHNMSDIPVREALRRLESEGYVEIMASQGAVVCGFSRERLLEISQIKAVLEGYAARLSADFLTERDIKRLRTVNEQLRRATERHDSKLYAELNVKFHLQMYEVIPQTELYGMIEDLWRKYSITKRVFQIAPQRMEDSVREHEEIIRLAEHKAYDRLEMYVREHKIRSGLDLVDS